MNDSKPPNAKKKRLNTVDFLVPLDPADVPSLDGIETKSYWKHYEVAGAPSLYELVDAVRNPQHARRVWLADGCCLGRSFFLDD